MVLHAPLALATGVALAGGALASVVKLLSERRQKIDASGVGFLLSARQTTIGARQERPLTR